MASNKSFLLVFCFTALLFLSAACSNDMESGTRSESAPPFRIGAQIVQNNASRAYVASGPVDEGYFYITYVNLEGKNDLALVDFRGGVGAVTKDGVVLEWPEIGLNSDSQTLSTFYLDNVPGNSFSDEGLVTFTDSYHPFDAGEFDIIEGTNDLLWGMRQISRNAPVVNFELQHCLSLLNVEVKVDEALDVPIEELDIENAVVKITNLQHKAEKYDRLTGKLTLPENGKYEDLTLVDKTHGWAKHMEEINGNTKVLTYLSKDFVLPPQELLTTEERPRFTITFPGKDGKDGVTYSGMIPRTMEIQQPDGTIIPMTLSLLRGQEMTIHVRVSQDPLEIIFLPVTVVDWVSKGTFMLGVNQAGFDEASDLYGFIEALESGEPAKMERYGYQKDGGWIFNIFCDLTFNLSEVQNKLSEVSFPFSFDMNNWTITVVDEESGESYEITTSDQFVNLLTKGELPS